MTFELDTSGTVEHANVNKRPGPAISWSDLSPFTQGYVEAMLRPQPETISGIVRFSDLAPETLSRIIADCEARLRHCPSHGETNAYFGTTPHEQLLISGRGFWTNRQAGVCKNFPPLTVQLSDDGKVRFAGADQ